MSKKENIQNYAPKMIVDDKKNVNNTQNPTLDEQDKSLEEELLCYVAKTKAIFKSQQKDDPDLTFEEKLTIARNILHKSYCLFLSKFGHYMKKEHLRFFEKNKDEDYEVAYHFNRLQRYFNSSARQTDVRNRRYQALKTLIQEGEYFSETEMMKRNPLLYEHLIGQYMTEKQKNIRDNIDIKNITFVNLLMESIERDRLNEKQKLQVEEEQNIMEENDSDEEQEDTCASEYNEEKILWGRTSESQNNIQHKSEKVQNPHSISNFEKQILKQEFITNITIDDNEAYDNIDLRTQDEEDKYFDSESPETIGPAKDSNETEPEDELDIYMKSLKNFNLLSFGKEAEEDDEESVILNKKFSGRSKSALDHLTDSKLSTQPAVELPRLPNKKRKEGRSSDRESENEVKSQEELEIMKKEKELVYCLDYNYNDRPVYPPRLIKIIILNNPFSHILPKIIIQDSDEAKDSSKTEAAAINEEAEEDEEESAILNKKFSDKSKSVHGYLSDPKLCS
ncbi:Coiled-coil domain-containing protein 97 [Eufriesea mexicana]|uniref:Coiled-coil domain-containing protein 97 n=1 Tax=Eufriesea mexicana TaxID=516756 RepID=A0A310SS24_9HYME|nr:Coiled-coil domain-containing protein 97 [Eufriesea mexicana]